MNATASQAGYTLDFLAEVTGVSTQTIMHYEELGLIPTEHDDETLRALRRIEHLRETCGMNLHGLKALTSLLDEVELLRRELRAQR